MHVGSGVGVGFQNHNVYRTPQCSHCLLGAFGMQLSLCKPQIRTSGALQLPE